MESQTKIILEPKRLRFKLSQLRKDALFTDITLRCHDKSLHVHKCILSNSSIFFKLLFSQEPIQELDLTSLIYPEDFENLESIVSFMYSGVICLKESNFVIISSLAQYFSIIDLTAFCTNFLQKILHGNNCVKLFCGIRDFERALHAMGNTVTVNEERKIGLIIQDMISSIFYKDVLLQDAALQLTAEDLQYLLQHVDPKDFCFGNTLTFLVKWLKVHCDLGSDILKVANHLIQISFERIVEQGQKLGGNAAAILEELDNLHIILISGDIDEDIRIKLDIQLKAIMEEVLKALTDGELEIKQEVELEMETVDETGETNVEENMTEMEDVIKDNVVAEDVIKDGVIEDDEIENDVIKDDVVEDDVIEDDIIEDDVVEDDVVEGIVTEDEMKIEAMEDEDDDDEDLNWSPKKTRASQWKLKLRKKPAKNKAKPKSKPVKGKEKKGKVIKVGATKKKDIKVEEKKKKDIKLEEKKKKDIKLEENKKKDIEIGNDKKKTQKKEDEKDDSYVYPQDGEDNAAESGSDTELNKGKLVCTVCLKVCANKKALYDHEKSHSRPYKCVVCLMTFGRSYHLTRHMKTQHWQMEKFDCDLCTESFEDSKLLVTHLSTHISRNMPIKNKIIVDEGIANICVLDDGKKEFRCILCDKTFSRHFHLKEHIMIHTGQRPYECEICKKKFKAKYELTKHTNAVHLGIGNQFKFKCEKCKRGFNLQETFERHKKNCVPGTFVCKECGASFQRKYHLNRHSAIHSEDTPHTCPHCEKGFKYAYKLKAHVRTHEEPEKSSVICELCGAMLKDVRYLKRHMLAHSGLKPHKCKICQKSYSQAGSLRVHLRKHSGAKPFQCEICSMLFAVKSNLMRHQRRHRGDKRHKCDQCGKGFVMMCDLRRHYTVHTGEKKHACRYCGKKFSSKSKVPQHERIHTGEKPYGCRVCGKRFIQSGDRYRHEATHGIKAPPKLKPLLLESACNQSDTEETQEPSNTKHLNSSDKQSNTSSDNKIMNGEDVNRTLIGQNQSEAVVEQEVLVAKEPIQSQMNHEDQPTDSCGNKSGLGEEEGSKILIDKSFAQAFPNDEEMDKEKVYTAQLVETDEAVQTITDQDPVNTEIENRTITLGAGFETETDSNGVNTSVAISSIGTDLNYINASLCSSQEQSEIFTSAPIYSTESSATSTFLATIPDGNYPFS